MDEQTTSREYELLYRWVLVPIHHLRGIYERKRLEGTHVVAYVNVDHTTGTRFLVDRTCEVVGVDGFTQHVVDARRDVLGVHPLDDASQLAFSIEAGRTWLRISLPDLSLRRALPDTPDLPNQIARLQSRLRAASYARRLDNARWLRKKNPFFPIFLKDPPDVPSARPVPAWLQRVPPLAVGAGALVALPLFFLRHTFGDALVVSAIHAAPSSAMWEWYIDEGGILAERTRAEWLPAAVRAEDEAAFAEAQRQDTSMIWRDYLLNHSIHAEEARWKHLPAAALREAIATGSVQQVRAFKDDFAEEGYAAFRAQADGELRRLYAAAFVGFSHHVSRRDKRIKPFFQRLFSWLETAGSPAIDVVFRPPTTEDLAEIDALNQRKRPKGCTSFAPAAPHFAASSLQGAEGRILELLQRGFSRAVDHQIVTLQQGEMVEEAYSRPTFEVAYTLTADRDVYYSSEDDPTSPCYAGLTVRYLISLSIPGERQPYTFRVTTRPPKRFEVTERATRFVSHLSSASVYEVMYSLAFSDLAEEMTRTLFAEDSDAAREIETALAQPAAENGPL